MQCPRCQQDNPPHAKFCLECATPLKSSNESGRPGASYSLLQLALSEARQREDASSEILRVISSSRNDLSVVFDIILDNVLRLCDAQLGALFLYDGDTFTMTAHRGAPPGIEEAYRGFKPGTTTGLGRMLAERQPIHIPDIRAEEAYRQGDPVRVLTADLLGARTFLAVPLLKDSAVLGAGVIYRREVRPFDETHIALLQTFADQAVIAIENVRLFTELEARNRELTTALDTQTATSDILRVISRSQADVQPVFEAIAENAARLVQAWSVTVLRWDGEFIHLAAERGGPPGSGQRLRDESPWLPNTTSGPGRCIATGTVIHVPDVDLEPGDDTATRELAHGRGWRSNLCVPMLGDGSPIGAISVTRVEAGPFSPGAIEILETFADQAVIAVENVRLFTELQEKNKALTQAHAQVTEALDQQTATSEILRTIAHTQTDLQPVFETIVRSAARLCHAVLAAVLLTDGRILHLPANYGSSPEALASVRARYPRPLDRETASGVAILTRSVVHVPDVQEPSVGEFTRQAGQMLGYRSLVTVPMLREGEVVGAITVCRREPGRFSDAEEELLKTFADQAVIAIENVRLFRETKEALERQTATSEILRVISSSPTNTQPVFDTIAENAARLCAARDAQVLRVEGDVLRLVSAYGSPSMPPVRAISRGHAVGRAVIDRQTIHVRDMAQAVREFPETSAPQHGVESILAVPLLRNDVAVGVIRISRTQIEPFTDAQITLLETFADQAVIAIENVRLFREIETRNRELTQALDRETATSEILRVISGSRTDLQPVFDTIVRNAVRLCGASHGGVYRFDGELVHSVAHDGYTPEQLRQWRATWPKPVTAINLACRAIVTRGPIRIRDYEAARDLARFGRETIANMRARGSRSVIAVPMFREDEVIGAISLAHRDVDAFSDTHIELLKTFAAQAVIAIENARLLKELEERTRELTRSVEQLTALDEVGRAVSSTLDLETVLTTIVSRAVQLSELDGGVVFEYDAGAEEFVHRVATETGGALAEARRATRVRKGEGVVGQTAITLEPAQAPDITLPGAYESRLRENLITSGVRAVLAVPMLSEDRLVGCLVVSRNQPGGFPAETIDLLHTFATQSALAIQNARLFLEIADKSQQLEAASRHKSEFLANMSHELRTPLNAVIGFSEVLLQRMFGALNDKQDEYLKDIYASGQHLLSLINDILDLSKIEAGRMELVPAPFHLPTALENAVTLVRERAGRHGIALHMDLDPRLGELVGDERKVKQVLLNLLSNAVKFTPEGGRISLKARRTDGAVEIAVTDTGIGIAPEDQVAVFEEFRQVGNDDARKQEGTGLGLTLAKKFVELHRGWIWVESEVGRGSTFTFTLPVS